MGAGGGEGGIISSLKRNDLKFYNQFPALYFFSSIIHGNPCEAPDIAPIYSF